MGYSSLHLLYARDTNAIRCTPLSGYQPAVAETFVPEPSSGRKLGVLSGLLHLRQTSTRLMHAWLLPDLFLGQL